MSKIRTWVLGGVAGRFYIDLNHDVEHSLLISGTPRSGSTWLADLLLQNVPYRLVFEPIRHGNSRMQSYEARYIRTNAPSNELCEEFRHLLCGTRRDRRLDGRNRRLLAQGRLVKGVSTNLMLGWFEKQFPSVPVVFLVRHPLLVVASYMRMSWLTPKDPRHWLQQEELMADHLGPLRTIIESATTPLEKSALEWCVLNYVPSRQSHSDRFVRVRYEHILQHPEQTLTDTLTYLGMWRDDMRWRGVEVPSHTAESSVADRARLGEKWRSTLSDSDRLTIERYVREFGLEEYLDA